MIGENLIVSEKFVYLHNPKTGGTFIRAMLKKVAPLRHDLQIRELKHLKHAGVRIIPREFRERPIVTTVRHPMAHYVSRYHFAGWERKLPTEIRASLIRERYPAFPNLTFSEFLRLCNDWDVILPSNSKLKRTLMNGRIGSETRALLGLIEQNPADFLRNMDALSDEGLARNFQHVKFLKTETLNQDLHDFLLSIGFEPARIAFILEQERILPRRKLPIDRRLRHIVRDLGKKQDWRNYYIDEELRWVGDFERFFFRLFPNSYNRLGYGPEISGRPSAEPSPTMVP
jgi:hypothetical protein